MEAPSKRSVDAAPISSIESTPPQKKKINNNIYIYIYISVYVYIYIYIPTYLPTYLPTCLPTYLPTYLSIYLSIYHDCTLQNPSITRSRKTKHLQGLAVYPSIHTFWGPREQRHPTAQKPLAKTMPGKRTFELPQSAEARPLPWVLKGSPYVVCMACR